MFKKGQIVKFSDAFIKKNFPKIRCVENERFVITKVGHLWRDSETKTAYYTLRPVDGTGNKVGGKKLECNALDEYLAPAELIGG